MLPFGLTYNQLWIVIALCVGVMWFWTNIVLTLILWTLIKDNEVRAAFLKIFMNATASFIPPSPIQSKSGKHYL